MNNVDMEKVLEVVGSVLKVLGHVMISVIFGLGRFMIYLTKCAMIGFRL